MMTNEEAYSWITQPGIQATLFRFDRHTNESLRKAIEALKAQSGKDINVRGKDTVYRQDAIDAATVSAAEWDEMYVQDMNVRIMESIKALPSAEPEIIRCKNCTHYSDRKCNSSKMWQSLYGNLSEVEFIERDPEDFCSYARKKK